MKIATGTQWYFQGSINTLFVTTAIYDEAIWKMLMCHELTHATCRNEAWVNEVVAEGGSQVLGWPRRGEIILTEDEMNSLDRVDRSNAEREYNALVRCSFARFLISEYGEGVIRQIVSSGKLGWEAMPGPREEMLRKWKGR